MIVVTDDAIARTTRGRPEPTKAWDTYLGNVIYNLAIA